jgi:primosomal protein N' (replication factor Y)
MNLLFIYPRRGLYRITKCENCGHVFECENCDASLVTYRQSNYKLELMCHQCQSSYDYPLRCPSCKSNKIISRVGGIDELVEELEKEFETSVYRFDKGRQKVIDIQKANLSSSRHFDKREKSVTESDSIADLSHAFEMTKGEINQIKKESLDSSDQIKPQISVSTRIFDPAIPYSTFDKIIFVQAENLLASPDYLVHEETLKQIAEVLFQAKNHSKIVFDTNSPNIELFQELIKLNQDHPTPESPEAWYLRFLEVEKQNRERFGFPPFRNLLLLTTQEKNKDKAFQALEQCVSYLEKVKHEIPEVSFGSPYPARFLRRKNMYSYHLLIRFPRQYEHFGKLRKVVTDLSELFRLQVRLNPRHLF